MAVELDPRRVRTSRGQLPAPGGATASRSRTGDAPRAGVRGELRPRAGRSAVLGPRHAPVAPRRALAKAPGPGRGAGRDAAPDPRRREPRRCGRAGGWSTRPAPSMRAENERQIARFPRTAARDFPPIDLSGPYPESGRGTGVGSSRLCRTGTGRTASSSPRSRDASRMSERSMRRTEHASQTSRRPRAGCPRCGEPWLRPTQLPGSYRCVYCLVRYQLMSTARHCGEHSTIVRMSDTDEPELRALRRLDAEAGSS